MPALLWGQDSCARFRAFRSPRQIPISVLISERADPFKSRKNGINNMKMPYTNSGAYLLDVNK